jgi:hypothetical protein
MTLRTGKGGRYRYYTCSIKARQGETGCKGRSIPMEKLDNLVAGHIEDRLLQPERLEEVLASVLDRRQERTERRREHIAELNKRAAETDLRLKRLYDAIESGVADLNDPALKERIAGLKAIRDQAQADAERAQAMAESAGQQAITPAMVQKFARTARERIRIEGGGYRRDHLRALAQRVEVADGEVRIMGSKGDLLRTLAAASGVKSAMPGVRSSVLKWRRGRDSPRREVTSTISTTCPEAASSVCTSPAYQFQHRIPQDIPRRRGCERGSPQATLQTWEFGFHENALCDAALPLSAPCAPPQHGLARAGEYQLMEMFSRLSRIQESRCLAD